MSRLSQPVSPADHILGPDGAPVTLLEYGDFECPFCGRANRVVTEVLHRFADRVRYVFRHFPLTHTHAHALAAAEAAEAAAAQGRFWHMHAMLFEHQDALEFDDLLEYARALGLDVRRFAADLRSGRQRPKVTEDYHSGVRSGVTSTPTFFINETRFDLAWDPDTLSAALAEAA
jgi:protein-disulfide isomerase